jgi:hypothetical protein
MMMAHTENWNETKRNFELNYWRNMRDTSETLQQMAKRSGTSTNNVAYWLTKLKLNAPDIGTPEMTMRYEP